MNSSYDNGLSPQTEQTIVSIIYRNNEMIIASLCSVISVFQYSFVELTTLKLNGRNVSNAMFDLIVHVAVSDISYPCR